MTKKELLKKARGLGLEFRDRATVGKIKAAIASYESSLKKVTGPEPTRQADRFKDIKALITYRTDRGVGILEFADLRNTGNKFSVIEPVDWEEVSKKIKKFLVE